MMVWWRKKGGFAWRFGYQTYLSDGLVRMGRWNGDMVGGYVVSLHEIETKEYRQ